MIGRTKDKPKAVQDTIADADQIEIPTEIESVSDQNEDQALTDAEVFVVIQHEESRTVIELPEDGELLIGRTDDADVVVAETKVSRHHARLIRQGVFLLLRDLGSRNGTRLNGSIVRDDERRLVSGDVLRVGSARITVAAGTGTSLESRKRRGRLDIELEQLEQATLIRISLPPRAPAGALQEMATILNTVALVEERGEEGEFAALVSGDAQTLMESLNSRLGALTPEMDLGVAHFPENGSDLSALWRATFDTKEDRDTFVEPPRNGVAVADPAMVNVFRVALRVAKTDATVLVLGETGSGKEVLSEYIHNNSARGENTYVRLNCASLPSTLLVSELFGHEKGAFTGAERDKVGYFEAAQGGTVLLDEIGELSHEAQVKLLRVLENRTVTRLGSTKEIPIDVRIICATHRDLQEEVAQGRFRQDLYYRVSAFSLKVPPLRERPTEIRLLSELFVRTICDRLNRSAPPLDPTVLAALSAHSWPGNVRELRNAIEHAVVMCDQEGIRVEHLPTTLTVTDGVEQNHEPSALEGPGGVKDKLAQIERASIVKALADQNGNQTRAAKQLGMSRRSLIYKMGKYDIKRNRG